MLRRALILIVLAPLAIGCGSQPANQLSDAQKAMTKAGSSRMEMTIRFDKSNGITGEGLFDYASSSGRMTLRPMSPHYKDSFPGEALFVGRTSYSGWMLIGRMVWLKESDYQPSGTETFIPGPGGPRPDRVLTLLINAGKKTEKLGSETIRGVKSQHYRVHLDPAKFGSRFDQANPTWEPVAEAWVDGEGLIRRLEMPTGKGGPVEIVEFFDYGVPVDIQAPEGEDLVTQSEFDKLMHAHCKQRKENGLGVDESECTRSRVVEAGPIETMPRRVTDSK